MRIKEKRKQIGISQEKLSELCNLSPSYIGVIERGEKRLSVETLVKVANVLQVNADYLLGDSIKYDNTYYIDKTREYLNDMDEDEVKFAYELLADVREFMGKKKIDKK